MAPIHICLRAAVELPRNQAGYIISGPEYQSLYEYHTGLEKALLGVNHVIIDGCPSDADILQHWNTLVGYDRKITLEGRTFLIHRFPYWFCGETILHFMRGGEVSGVHYTAPYGTRPSAPNGMFSESGKLWSYETTYCDDFPSGTEKVLVAERIEEVAQ